MAKDLSGGRQPSPLGQFQLGAPPTPTSTPPPPHLVLDLLPRAGSCSRTILLAAACSLLPLWVAPACILGTLTLEHCFPSPPSPSSSTWTQLGPQPCLG